MPRLPSFDQPRHQAGKQMAHARAITAARRLASQLMADAGAFTLRRQAG